MPLLLFFAFLSGLVTILAPCIWPLLPIILSSSIAGSTQQSHHRPLGITLGIMISFGFFTLFISSLVSLFHFDPNMLRIVAVIVIGFLGITMIIPAFSSLLETLVSRLTGLFGSTTNTNSNKQNFWGGFITGLSLGIVWSPCAGPILAAIATLSATGKVTFFVILITIAYVIGVGIPLFIFSFASQKIILHSRLFSKYTGRIQQIFGVIMLLMALAIYTNYDKYLQAQLLNAFPQFSSTIDSFETSGTVTNQLSVLKGQKQPALSSSSVSGLFNDNTPAPDFVGITKWLNLPNGKTSLSLADLKGKVVLVDFWTYTCINCIRTLPFVTSWYNKYKDDGFVVIGVHTPEFAFEHNTANVENAIKMFGITYPVAQDNNYATWNNYNNSFWPAEYLIDAKGVIRRTHFGEGEYDQSEMAIKALLAEAGKKVATGLVNMPDQTPTGQISPETYVGANRAQYFYPNGNLATGVKNYTLTTIPENSFDLGGSWNIQPENAITGKNAILEYHFYANKVFLVLNPGSAGVDAKVKVVIDGKVVDANSAGADVKNGLVTIDSDRLYNLIDLHGSMGSHILRLEFQSEGIQLFAFTFG